MIVTPQASTIRMRRMPRQLNSQRKNRTSVLRSQTEDGRGSFISNYSRGRMDRAAASRNETRRHRNRFSYRRLHQFENLAAILAQFGEQMPRWCIGLFHSRRGGRPIDVEESNDQPR